MAEGGNPLTDMHDLPRWEDEVGIDRIINRRVMELDPLPTPVLERGVRGRGPIHRRERRDEIQRPARGELHHMLGLFARGDAVRAEREYDDLRVLATA